MDMEASRDTSLQPLRSKTGRRPRAAVTEKIATLEAQLAAARAEARDVAKARAGIVGSVVVDAMKENPEFARGVVALLKAKVRSARDKALIADLLVPGASS